MAKCGGGSVLTVLLQCFSLTVVVAMATTMAPMPAPAYTKTGCSNSCGNVSIPFPFGVEEGCYLDDTFRISCGSPGRPFLANSLVLPNKDKKIEVLGIFLDGRLRASAPVAQDCYNNSGTETRSNAEYVQSNFPISYAWNKFVSVGCNGNAALGTFSTTLEVDGYVSACASACNSMLDVVNGSCSRIGCCQTDIPKNMTEFVILASNSADHQNVSRFSPCNYAFVVERGVYNFSSADIVDLQNVDDFPVIFDWAIGNTGCQEAKKIPETFACRDNNSFCYDFDNRFGYRCNCTEGYRGNPYLPQGCQDINECEENSHDCPDAKFCHNTVGSYTCSCPKGHHGDGRMSGGGGCIADRPQNNKIIIGTSVGVFAVLVAVSFAHFAIKRRNAKRNRERCFKENGGLLLQRLLSKTDPSEKRGTIFSESELKKATKDFSQSEVIGEGGFGMVYKGTLDDGRAVAIKKSRKVDRREVQQFINEVNILSQINHPNVVKLIGCCLDSQIPMLVSEFITNNTLFHHLHEEGKKSSLSWEVRLRIALETAKALVCMHSIMPMQIIHRDIKSANILLDDNFTAKVSDFGISRLVPLDQYELPTDVQGTLGYIDPEYFDTGLLNEKSDVYSFGIILAELLTGKRVIYPKKPEQNLATVFVSAVEKGELFQILEDRVRKEGRPDQLLRIAKLTRRCLRRRKDERPTMKAVEKELEETTLEIVEHQ